MSAKKRSVVWTEVAAKDLERLAGYLAEEAPLRAKGIIDGIVARAESLVQAPNRGRIPPELRSVGQQEWREVQEPPWRILYRVAESRVEIHGVLDGRRNLEDILMERMLRP
ncbi:MAG: type II toxin-antitoxin system RelE/ParE family toxin [Candidatus Binatia bacterium]